MVAQKGPLLQSFLVLNPEGASLSVCAAIPRDGYQKTEKERMFYQFMCIRELRFKPQQTERKTLKDFTWEVYFIPFQRWGSSYDKK